MKNYIKAIVTFMFLMTAAILMPNTASAVAPAAPTGIHQTGASNNYVDVAWNAVPNADRYYWSWSVDGVSGWSEGGAYDWSSSPKDTISSLSAGSTYYVRVRAANTSNYSDYEYSDWSQPIQVVTAPDVSQMGKPTLKSATTNSLTIEWTACPGATSYEIYDYYTDALLGTTAVPTFEKTGLTPNTSYSMKVVPVRTSNAGYTASKAYGYSVLSGAETKPSKPVTPSTKNFGITNFLSSINIVYFGATDPTGATKDYEIEVYTLKGKKKVFTGTRSNDRFEMHKNTTYKFRCRFYATYGNEKIPGNWSGYRYFVNQSVSCERGRKNAVKVGWKKVAGAKSYTVSISTKEKGGYKKVKTLGSKSSSLTVSKCGKSKLKRGKTYYIKVVANLKDGKKSVKSDSYAVNRIMLY